MRVQITGLRIHLQFIISSDSEPMACVTELAHSVAVNSRETEPRAYLLCCLPGGKWQQGARETLGNGNGGMKDERQPRGQMETVMAQEIKTNKQTNPTIL